MDDDLLIQNRNKMFELLQRLPGVYAAAARNYEFVPGSYSHEVMRLLSEVAHDARGIIAPEI